jgi:hypothetical protein
MKGFQRTSDRKGLIMKTPTPRSTFISARSGNPPGDEQLQDEFDELVMKASRGDRRAIGSIAVALGPMLLKEARGFLGRYAEEDEDVLQDLLVFLLEQRSPFRPERGRAVVWLRRLVRAIAQTRREENGRR